MLARTARAAYYRLTLPASARQVRRERLTYLSPAKLQNLYRRLRQIKKDAVAGDFLEFGVALGGSAVVIASELDGARRFHGYDVFAMIPPPTDQDDEKSKARYEVIRAGQSAGLGGDVYYGYLPDLFARVCQTFARYGYPVDGERIVLHKGLFEDSVVFVPDTRVAFAHIDCDWYEPVKLCLNRVAPHLSRNGIVVLDDYNDYGGCRKATTEFLADQPAFRLIQTLPHAVIQKT